jgi:hypothetical protein
VTAPEGLRIAGARLARAIYTFRNKRNIAHIGEVDPNSIDLAFTANASAWIVSEMLRVATGVSMEEAGRLIAMVQAPIGQLVEEIDGVRIVHGNVTLQEELLILLHSHYADYVSLADIQATTKLRNAGSVGNKLRDLVGDKLAVGDTKTGYKLTSPASTRPSAPSKSTRDYNVDVNPAPSGPRPAPRLRWRRTSA